MVSYRYDAWGNITASTGTATTGDGRLLKYANPFRYAGYQYDSETSLYYLKSRYYSPTLGRFITRDVVPAVNLYAYVGYPYLNNYILLLKGVKSGLIMKKNNLYYAIIGTIIGINIKYIPAFYAIILLILMGLWLLFTAIKGRMRKESYLYTGLYLSFSVVSFTIAIIKALPMYLKNFQRYEFALWVVFISAVISALTFGFVGAFKYGDKQRKRLTVLALGSILFCLCLVIFLKITHQR